MKSEGEKAIKLSTLNSLCGETHGDRIQQNYHKVDKGYVISFFFFFLKFSFVHPWHDRFWILLFNLHTVTAFSSLIPCETRTCSFSLIIGRIPHLFYILNRAQKTIFKWNSLMMARKYSLTGSNSHLLHYSDYSV